MKIGLISDTHGLWDPRYLEYLDSCDEIWHAGDIGSMEVVQKLANQAPVVAVFGNIDGNELRSHFPENLEFERSGLKILMTHIAGKPPRYNQRVKQLIKTSKPDLLVCGHSHILQIMRDPDNQLIFMNPGAAGRHGFHIQRTLVRFDLSDGKLSQLEVVELGKRART